MADKGVQTSLRLPRDLYDQLAKAAGDRGIGEEIRQRLEASLAAQPRAGADPKTEQLIGAIAAVANFLTVERGPVSEMLRLDPPLGPWYRDPVAFAALRKALERFLSLLGPAREPEGIEIDASERLAAAAIGSGLSQVMTTFPPGAVIAPGSFAATKREGGDR